jgi:S1-C subfamily serine protease
MGSSQGRSTVGLDRLPLAYTGNVIVLLALLIALAPPTAQTAVLRVTVTVTAADGSVRPVPRHVLLISDDPVSMSPQRFVTTSNGTAEAHLKPGRYVVESDNPFVFEGKSYEWSQPVTVAPTGETTLALTGANASVEAASPGAVPSAAAAEERVETTLLNNWQASVVAIWTPTRVGRGFLIDARGLVATNQRLIGSSATVEVQLSATTKVAGRVIANDPNRNVGSVWIDSHVAAAARPLTLALATGESAAVAEREKIYAIEAPASGSKDVVSGTVDRVTAHTVSSDVPLGRDSAGVPLLNAAGAVVAITTEAEEASVVNELSPRSVRIDDARPAIAQAETQLQTAPAPAGALLPVDPGRPFPEEALKNAAKARGNASAYLVAASDFDVNIITPPVLYASMHHTPDREQFDYARDDRVQTQPMLRPLDDFGTWNEYVSDAPPVVMIRVTPKFGESFWTTVARGAAQTQGVAIPAIKRPKAAFGSLRLACGDQAIAPIHPFRIAHRIDDTTSLDEGLYVFDASAISPQCGTVTVTVFSDKANDKGDVRTIDARIVQQVWDDFAAYRAAAGK